jgi:hypothetical protein
LQAGTSTSGLSPANPYLQAGTSTSGLSQANPYLQAGTQGADQLIGNYMNPYTKDVVNQIGAANQQNIAQNLSAGITSGAVGSGQFGSQRGANALALGISNADIGALTQQTQAMQSGYAQALAAAQAQRANQLTAGTTAGQLQNTSNTNDINAGTTAGQLQNTSNTNAINAGTTAGQLQNASNTNNINAGTTAGQLQNASNTNNINAGTTAGQLQNTSNTNYINAGSTAGQLQNASNTNNINAANSATNAAFQQGTLGLNAGQNQAAQAAQLQSLGLTDTNALGVLGGQKQAQAQAKVMQPLDVLNKQAGIMSGAQLPTSVAQISNASPLSTISGLGSTAVALLQSGPNNTPSVASNIGSGISSAASTIGSGISDAYNGMFGSTSSPTTNYNPTQDQATAGNTANDLLSSIPSYNPSVTSNINSGLTGLSDTSNGVDVNTYDPFQGIYQ